MRVRTWKILLERGANTEFVQHKVVYEPVPEEEDIGSRGDGLGESQEEAGGLGEARGVEADAILELCG